MPELYTHESLVDPGSLANQFQMGLYMSLINYMIERGYDLKIVDPQFETLGDAESAYMLAPVDNYYDTASALGVNTIPRVEFSKQLFTQESENLYPLVVKNPIWNRGQGKFVVNNGLDLAKVMIALSIFGNYDSCVRDYREIYKSQGNVWNHLDMIDQFYKKQIVIEDYIEPQGQITSYRIVASGKGDICYGLRLTSEVQGQRIHDLGTKSKVDFLKNKVAKRFSGIQFEDMVLCPDSYLFIDTPEFRSNSGSTTIVRIDLSNEVNAPVVEAAKRLQPIYRNQLFVGIDFLFDEISKKHYLLEINSWPEINLDHLGIQADRNDSLAAYKALVDKFY